MTVAEVDFSKIRYRNLLDAVEIPDLIRVISPYDRTYAARENGISMN